MRLIDADALIQKAYDEAKGMAEPYDDFGTLVEWLVDKAHTIEPDSDTISRKQTLEHIKHRLYESALNNDGIASKIFEEIADNRVQIWVDELPPSPHRP